MSSARAVASTAVLLLAGLALAACGTPPPKPEPPTQQELEAIQAEQAQSWWDSMSTGTTMPDVAVIEQLPYDDATARQTQCLDDAQIPGVTVYGPGEWSFTGTPSDEAAAAAQLQWWVCAQQFPAVSADDDWILSPDELAWLYDFFVERYEPCLGSVGIELLDLPSREHFISGGSGGYPAWLPYEQTVRPIPTTAGWARLAERCPLPEMLEYYELPGYQEQ